MSDVSGAAAPPEGGRKPFNNEPPEPYPEPDAGVEQRARSMGWAPREEWKGDPARWKTAEEFVAFVDNTQHIGVLRENMRRMETRITEQGRELTESRDMIKDQREVLVQLRDWASRSEQAGYDRAKRELQERQRAAVASADTAAHEQATRELNALEEGRRAAQAPPTPEPPRAPASPPPATPPQKPPGPSPEMARFFEEQAWWYYSNAEMQQSAIALYAGQTSAHPDWGDGQKLAEVLRRIKLMYPEKFRNARRDAPPVVHEPGAPPPVQPPPGAKFDYNSLSATEKEACDRFCRTIPGYTREKYIEEYLRQEEIRKERSGG